MQERSSLASRWSALAPSKGNLVWACALCVAATLLLGFTWGGWMTGASARALSEDAAASARHELAAAVCVERFQAAGDMAARLTALKELQSWGRVSFIDKGGWAKMPDRAEPTSRAATLCATQLFALEVPPATLAVVPQ